eukprot:gnl/MRDRNA2_/MRDRNA2_112039_c0_seq1.p1 gnl/MRDRNA2_/MRDRNA2_112039_c0~~gnl/MRDRNA2_/MRDRNA2_112039_c0_seq1.p1  ORF type:complete len:1328 (+),score=217.90 gnl/MRDRNA2_/MRDRNA2_112039_c0_seq1:426-3986(+)
MPLAHRSYYKLACLGGYPEELIKEVDEKVLLRAIHHSQTLLQASNEIAPIKEGRTLLLGAMEASVAMQANETQHFSIMKFAAPGALQMLLTEVELPPGMKSTVETGQWYFWWVQNGEILFLQRREALAFCDDETRTANALGGYAAACSVARNVEAQAFDLSTDVQDLTVRPEDDEHVILKLQNGIVLHFHGYSEVRTWIDILTKGSSQGSEGSQATSDPDDLPQIQDGPPPSPKKTSRPAPKKANTRTSGLNSFAANKADVITAELKEDEEHGQHLMQAVKSGIAYVLLGKTAALRNNHAQASWFTYKTATFPHTAKDIFVETPNTNTLAGNANSLAGLMWYSHGGHVLSITVWKGAKTHSPYGKLKQCEQQGVLDLGAASPKGARLSRGATKVSLILGKQEATGFAHADFTVLGLYIADLVSVFEEPRTDYDIVSNRHSLLLTLDSGALLRFFFTTRLERSLVRTSLLRMRGFMKQDPPKSCTDLVVSEMDDEGTRSRMESDQKSGNEDDAGLHGCMRITLLSAGIMWQSDACAQLAQPVAANKKTQKDKNMKEDSLNKVMINRNPKAIVDSGAAISSPTAKLVTSRTAVSTLALATPATPKPEEKSKIINEVEKKKTQGLPTVFCIVYVSSRPRPERAEVWRSRRAVSTSYPIWNEVRHHEIHFPASSHPPADLRIEAWDGRGMDRGKPPSYMGEVKVPPPKTAGYHQYHMELQANLDKMQDKSKPCEGYVSFELLWTPTKQSTDDGTALAVDGLKAESTANLQIIEHPPRNRKTLCGTLTLGICSAKGLRRADLLSSDPYCVVRVKSTPTKFQTWKTSVRPSTTNPVWNETHEFKVNWPAHDCFASDQIYVEVWDYDRVSQHDFLGEVAVPFVWHEEREEYEVPLQSNRAKNQQDSKGSITISLAYRTEFDVQKNENAENMSDRYAMAFDRCFASSVVDDTSARRIAPYLVYLHFSVARILYHCMYVEFGQAVLGLPAVFVPNTNLTRVERFAALLTSVMMGLAAAAYLVPGAVCFPRARDQGSCLPPEVLSPWLAFGASMVVQKLWCMLILCLFTKTPRTTKPSDLAGKIARSWKRTVRAWQFTLFMLLACFVFIIGSIGDETWLKNWLMASGCFIALRFIGLPLLWVILWLLVLLLSRITSMFDWLLLLYPSMIPMIEEETPSMDDFINPEGAEPPVPPET